MRESGRRNASAGRGMPRRRSERMPERKRGTRAERRMPSLECKRGKRMPSLGSGRRHDVRGRMPSPKARAAPHSTR